MANVFPLFTNFIFLLIIHLGCFNLSPTTDRRHRRRRRRGLSSSWSFLKRIFSSEKPDPNPSIFHQISSPPSSTRSLIIPPDPSLTRPGFGPTRNDIHPCPICGEVFQKPLALEQHQFVKHAVSELSDEDPGKNIVRIIFQTGWPGNDPVIHRVMKIHHGPKILTRFEEYRESVKLTAARHGGSRRRNERCIADGNELLRFHCATFLCDLGQNGNSSICSHQYCSVCGIIRVGFSPKLDGISTSSTSWRAHVAIPEDVEVEFGFMNVKRAMLVCRVIAGRVGCDPGVGDKDDPGYDSLVGREPGGAPTRMDDLDELVVFNPRAVLPCFVISYTV